MKNFIWFERYRPQAVEQMVLTPETRNLLETFVKSREIPHLLLYGRPGSGKTTIARILISLLPCSKLELNASGKDRGVEMMRGAVVDFASSMPSMGKRLKIVFMDECLEENETIRIGTVDDWKDVPLKELTPNTTYPVVSFNMETQQYENDECFLCVDKEDDLYEVELSDGRKIVCNANHPFVVQKDDGSFEKVRVKDGITGKKVPAI